MTHHRDYCIRTNILNLSEQEILENHINQTAVVSVIRYLKPELELMPICHRKDEIVDRLFLSQSRRISVQTG